MVGDKIRTMLEEEIKASGEFARRNFGLAVGDDFREIVEEALKSKDVTAHLMLGLLIAAMSAKDFGNSLKPVIQQEGSMETNLPRVIIDNFEAFRPSMEFLYWGIQIGKKLALQEVEMFKRLEKEG